VDRRGGLHILAHVYTSAPFAPGAERAVSGHAYSADGGAHWAFSAEQPYSAAVRREGGAVQNFATLERPKVR
jgi:hypothetical protein